MKGIKIAVIFTSSFILLYSCATLSPSPSLASSNPIKEEKREIKNIKRDTITVNQNLTKEEYQEMLNNSLKEFSTKPQIIDNSKQIKELRLFIDSLSAKSRESFKLNNELAFNDLIKQRGILGERELLLIERENNLKLSEENTTIKQEGQLETKYMGIILSTGLILNILLSLYLVYLKRRVTNIYA